MQRSEAFPAAAAAASLVGMRHSTTRSAGLKYASPRLARRSVMFRTAAGIGTVTETSCSDGAADVAAPEPNTGVERPEARAEPNPGRDANGEVKDEEELVVEGGGESRTRISKSAPVGPSKVEISGETGNWRFVFDQDLRSECEGNRFTSYPASTNFPSGGTKLSSPGFSFQRANLTQGWKTGNSMAFSKPSLPPEAESVKSRSGTPEIFDVNAMEPLAKAANGRPDGASVTESFSTMSTYSSLLVWRTLARRQGIAGPVVEGLREKGCLRPAEG